jgi:hypothetical protein
MEEIKNAERKLNFTVAKFWFCLHRIFQNNFVIVKNFQIFADNQSKLPNRHIICILFYTLLHYFLSSICLILPVTLHTGFYLASNRNEYQKHKLKNASQEYQTADAWGWQPHRHLWADCLNNVGSSTSQKTRGLHGLLLRKLHFNFFMFILSSYYL